MCEKCTMIWIEKTLYLHRLVLENKCREKYFKGWKKKENPMIKSIKDFRITWPNKSTGVWTQKS